MLSMRKAPQPRLPGGDGDTEDVEGARGGAAQGGPNARSDLVRPRLYRGRRGWRRPEGVRCVCGYPFRAIPLCLLDADRYDA